MLLGLFNIIAILVVPAHLILFWQQVRRQHGTIRPWRILGPLVVIVALGPSFLLATTHQDAQVNWIGASYGLQSVIGYLPNLFGSAPVAVMYVAVGLVFVGMYALQQTPASSSLLCWALLPPLALIAISVVHPLFYYRYLLYTVPAWCLISGVVVARAAPHGGAPLRSSWHWRQSSQSRSPATTVRSLPGSPPSPANPTIARPHGTWCR